MAGLLVETDDFAYAAWALSGGAGDPLTESLFRLQNALEGCAGMAGSDPAGRSWAAVYDGLSADALTGLRALANGCYRLASMFAQTCRNYAAAERASTADRWARESADVDVAQLPGDCSVTWDVSVPAAAGASSGAPPGWSLVAGLVGRIWPGGHQDRLRAAAAAWRSAAQDVDEVGARIQQVPRQFAADQMPEADDMAAVCQATVDAAERLAVAMRQAAGECDELAAELDRVHQDVEQELTGLLETSVVIEGVGQLCSVLSLGAAEAPTQAVEGGRLAVAAARIAELLDACSATVAGLAARLPAFADIAASVGRGLTELFDRPLVAAAVTPVRTLEPEVSTVNGVTRVEMEGERALAAESSETLSFGTVDLRAEEAAGGHTIAKHVGLTRAELVARNVPRASTFTDLEAAESAISDNLAANRTVIEKWLSGHEPRLAVTHKVDPKGRHSLRAQYG